MSLILSVAEKSVTIPTWERITYSAPCLQTRMGQISLSVLAGLALFLALGICNRAQALARIAAKNANCVELLSKVFSGDFKTKQIKYPLQQCPLWNKPIPPTIEDMAKTHPVLLGEWRDDQNSVYPAIYIKLLPTTAVKGDPFVLSAKFVLDQWQLFETEDNNKLVTKFGASAALQLNRRIIEPLLQSGTCVAWVIAGEEQSPVYKVVEPGYWQTLVSFFKGPQAPANR